MTQDNRASTKHYNRTGQNGSAPKNGRMDAFEVSDDQRIDWERKQKGKKVNEETEHDVEEILIEETFVESVIRPPKSKKQHKKKHRQIIYDDERGQTIVKRKHRRQVAHHSYIEDFD